MVISKKQINSAPENNNKQQLWHEEEFISRPSARQWRITTVLISTHNSRCACSSAALSTLSYATTLNGYTFTEDKTMRTLHKTPKVSRERAIQIAANHNRVSKEIAQRYTDSELKEVLRQLRLQANF